jgi:1,4-dihydroxy-6-naphthoate synthase
MARHSRHGAGAGEKPPCGPAAHGPRVAPGVPPRRVFGRRRGNDPLVLAGQAAALARAETRGVCARHTACGAGSIPIRRPSVATARHLERVDAECLRANRPCGDTPLGFPVGRADRNRRRRHEHPPVGRIAPVGGRFERCGASPTVGLGYQATNGLPDEARAAASPLLPAALRHRGGDGGDGGDEPDGERNEASFASIRLRRVGALSLETHSALEIRATGNDSQGVPIAPIRNLPQPALRWRAMTRATPSTTPTIHLAFSPDSDDIFMFWPLLAGKVDPEGLVFEAERADTESLNARAAAADLDVVAVSIARWPSIARDYLLLPHGMSVGRGYGPVVVAERPGDLVSLRGARIGVPGLRTTAYMVLRLLLPVFDPVVIPIAPYARAFEAVRAGEVDAALLIHEGRLTFAREGFACLCDLGVAWAEMTGGLPLPLGGNAIRRGLGPALVAKVSRLLRASIAWSLSNREEVMRALLEEDTRTDLALDREMLDRYLAMYANSDTLDAAPDVRQAVTELYARAGCSFCGEWSC